MSKDKTHRVYRGNHWYNDRVWLWGDAQRLADPPPDMDISHTWVQTWFNASLGFRLVEEVGSTDSWSPRPHRGSVSFSYTNYAQNSICLMADPNRSGTGVGIRLVEEVADE